MKEASRCRARLAQFGVLLSFAACVGAAPVGVRQDAASSGGLGLMSGKARHEYSGASVLISALEWLTARYMPNESRLAAVVRESSKFSPGIIAICVVFPTLLLVVPLIFCCYCGVCSCSKRRGQAGAAAVKIVHEEEDDRASTARRSKLDCRLSEVGPVPEESRGKRSSNTAGSSEDA